MKCPVCGNDGMKSLGVQAIASDKEGWTLDELAEIAWNHEVFRCQVKDCTGLRIIELNAIK